MSQIEKFIAGRAAMERMATAELGSLREYELSAGGPCRLAVLTVNVPAARAVGVAAEYVTLAVEISGWVSVHIHDGQAQVDLHLSGPLEAPALPQPEPVPVPEPEPEPAPALVHMEWAGDDIPF